MEGLPSNIIIDILSRLPVKTIIHCKCVCKNWRHLIVSDSYFANIHLSRSPSGLMIHHTPEHNFESRTPGLLKWVEIIEDHELDQTHLHHDPVMSLDLHLAPVFRDAELHQVGSVDGLICLWEFGPEGDNTYICNPITREYMILPRQKYYRQGYAIIIYGFGVSLCTKEYKVVRTFQGEVPPKPGETSRPSLIFEAEVYTLGSGQWRSLGHVPYFLYGFQGGQFLNGQVHWFVLDLDSPEKLCAFDLDTETFQLFPSPPLEAVEGGEAFQSLAVLRGCLSMSVSSYHTRFTIWVMKEYGIKNSWHKQVVIEDSISPKLAEMWKPVYLLERLKDGSILMIYNFVKLLKYCPQTKVVEDVAIFDKYLWGLAYCPSFLKLQSFESEIVHHTRL